MAWTTIEEVAKVTGKTVTQDDIDIAAGICGLKVGVFQDEVPNVAGRDGRALRAMVSYEAVFVAENPDLFERLDVSSTSQDGQSASFKPDALILAPLAKLAMRRLSWKGTRSTSHEVRDAVTDPDDRLPWEPMNV